VSIIASSFLLLFGGIKFYLGISRDKPVTFLFILIIISVVVLFNVIKPHKVKYTALGKKFIDHSYQRFEWLKKKENDISIFVYDGRGNVELTGRFDLSAFE